MDTRSGFSRLVMARADRRSVVRAAGIAAVVAPFAGRVTAAQEASPAASPHDGHGGTDRTPPEVRWHWTPEGVEMTPSVTAGWNHVIVENGRDVGVHVLTIKLPDDLTDEQVAVLEDPDAPMPEWLLDQHFPGIPDVVEPGKVVEGYTSYAEGQYFWFELNTGMSGEFTVGPGSATRHVPVADVTVTMVEMAFLGLEEPLAAGPQLWQVDNRGATWHEIMVARTPDGMTAEEILEGLLAESLPTDDGSGPVAGYAITSPGHTGFLQIESRDGELCGALLRAGRVGRAATRADGDDHDVHRRVGTVSLLVRVSLYWFHVEPHQRFRTSPVITARRVRLYPARGRGVSHAPTRSCPNSGSGSPRRRLS